MLHLAAILAAALHTAVPVDSQALPGAMASLAYIDAATSLAGPLVPALAHLAPGRAGGAEVSLYNVNSRESATVYLRFDGVSDEVTAQTLAHFFRCKRSGRERRMNVGTLGLFAQLTAHYPGHVIEIVSGVRAPGNGAPDSKHYSGHAIDFRVRGVSTRKVRDLAWALDSEIGVGHYTGENFIHIDHRPGEGKIGWTQRRQGQANRYNPSWAKVAKPTS